MWDIRKVYCISKYTLVAHFPPPLSPALIYIQLQSNTKTISCLISLYLNQFALVAQFWTAFSHIPSHKLISFIELLPALPLPSTASTSCFSCQRRGPSPPCGCVCYALLSCAPSPLASSHYLRYQVASSALITINIIIIITIIINDTNSLFSVRLNLKPSQGKARQGTASHAVIPFSDAHAKTLASDKNLSTLQAQNEQRLAQVQQTHTHREGHMPAQGGLERGKA